MKYALLLITICIQAACAAPSSEDPARGEGGGKADTFGSCAGTDCSGQAPNGNCFCDDNCATVGDCCADKHEVCDTGCSDFALEFESAIGSGSGFSEIVINARGIPPAADKLLGKVSFLTSEFRQQRFEVPTAVAKNGQLILKLTGNRAVLRNIQLTHNGSVVYWLDPQQISMFASPQFKWVPFPTSCGGGAALAPDTVRAVKFANQISLRLDTPQFKNAFLWARVTSTPCATGTGLSDTGRGRVFWLEDGSPAVRRLANIDRATAVLQDFLLTSAAGKPGTLWVTSQNAPTGDPDHDDGHCEAELYMEYR